MFLKKLLTRPRFEEPYEAVPSIENFKAGRMCLCTPPAPRHSLVLYQQKANVQGEERIS